MVKQMYIYHLKFYIVNIHYILSTSEKVHPEGDIVII